MLLYCVWPKPLIYRWQIQCRCDYVIIIIAAEDNPHFWTKRRCEINSRLILPEEKQLPWADDIQTITDEKLECDQRRYDSLFITRPFSFSTTFITVQKHSVHLHSHTHKSSCWSGFGAQGQEMLGVEPQEELDQSREMTTCEDQQGRACVLTKQRFESHFSTNLASEMDQNTTHFCTL